MSKPKGPPTSRSRKITLRPDQGRDIKKVPPKVYQPFVDYQNKLGEKNLKMEKRWKKYS